MIIKCGTMDELKILTERVPMEVIKQIENYIGILNEAYGANRNYYRAGGYTIYAETTNDISEVNTLFLDQPNEWEESIGGYSIKLYLLGDDFSIVLCHPRNII